MRKHRHHPLGEGPDGEGWVELSTKRHAPAQLFNMSLAIVLDDRRWVPQRRARVLPSCLHQHRHPRRVRVRVGLQPSSDHLSKLENGPVKFREPTCCLSTCHVHGQREVTHKNTESTNLKAQPQYVHEQQNFSLPGSSGNVCMFSAISVDLVWYRTLYCNREGPTRQVVGINQSGCA